MQIILDPTTNIYYSSFYIQGLIKLYGKQNIRFESFPFLYIKTRSHNFDFVICKQNQELKISIDYDDISTIKEECYNWCDIYGKVNTNWQQTPSDQYPKLVSLAPGFGIRVWNLAKTLQLALSNTLKSNLNLTESRKLIGKYKRQYSLRLPISYYQPQSYTEKQPYIYHLSTLWYSDEWNQNDKGVNLTRANFVRACKSIESIRFEGGLIPQNQNRSSIALFQDVLYDHEVNVKEYIANTKQSWVVFNTPAFWNCHGWKLGEYLALGKAIISTPLSNDLPAPLIHGKHIHIIPNDNEDEIKKAVEFLIHNYDYRHKLEQGARRYWEQYGTPVQALKLMGIE